MSNRARAARGAADAAWSKLADPWRAAFELAWDAYDAGSVPVGAVVADPASQIVARGRSRSYETAAPDGQIAGTYLAHAEVNALLGLSRGEYWDHTVYTTLEPCLLCTAALVHAHVGKVCFAARDSVFAGIDRLPELNAHVRRRWHAREQHLDGPLARWAAVLPVVFRVERDHGAAEYRPDRRDPSLLHLARGLVASDLRSLSRPVLEVLSLLWPRLDTP